MTFWEKLKAMMTPPVDTSVTYLYLDKFGLKDKSTGQLYNLAVDKRGYVRAVPHAEWLVRKKG